MSLYVPAHFATDDRAAVARLMHDHPFATLLTPAPSGPFISHLPLLFVPACEPHGCLIGHFARANPHWKDAAGADSIAVFHGPHAYISPSWYAQPAKAVPTWNYAAVHAHGRIEIIDDPVEARLLLDRLVHRFEHHRPEPWQVPQPSPEHDAMVRAIVAFRMRITRLDAKFKLSQNRSAEDRRGVIDGLRADAYSDALATAQWMQAASDARDKAP